MEKVGKFAVGDVAWFLLGSEIKRGIVCQKDITHSERIGIKSDRDASVILHKWKDFYIEYETETEVWYKVVVVNEDETLGRHIPTRFKESELFATKDELIEFVGRA